jgi:hypothetical protein
VADDGQEQEKLVAEPEEYNRWAMTCLLGFVGISLICISIFVMEKSTTPPVRHRPNVALSSGFCYSFWASLFSLFSLSFLLSGTRASFIHRDK